MPQTISALARAMFSRLPSMPICEVPTFVMTAMSGRAQRDRRSIWPRPSMPISTTRASVSRGAESTVRGRPMRLLKFPDVAWTR